MLQAICETCDLWFWPGTDNYESIRDTGECIYCEMRGCKQDTDQWD